MKTMTVRDIRQRWPEAERMLAEEGEIIVTRDSKPVAKIVPYVAPVVKRGKVKRFNAEEHMKWLKRISADDKPGRRSTDEILREMRDKGHALVPIKPA